MKKLIFALMVVCMIAGCGSRQGPAIKVGVQSEQERPLDVVIQAKQALPVQVDIQEDKALSVEIEMPMEVKVNSEQPLPVKLNVGDGKSIPVRLNIPEDQGLPVQIKLPQKASALFAVAAFVGLCIVVTSFVVAIVAVLSAKKARNIAKSAYLAAEDVKTAQRQHQRQLYGFDQ